MGKVYIVYEEYESTCCECGTNPVDIIGVFASENEAKEYIREIIDGVDYACLRFGDITHYAFDTGLYTVNVYYETYNIGWKKEDSLGDPV